MVTLSGLRVAVYARFSSENQKDSSIEDQVRVCRAHVARLEGHVANDRIFADYAVSGASNSRAGFDQLLRLIETQGIDGIVTESGSRLSRDLGDSDRLWKLAKFRGVRIICVNDGVDSASEGARMGFAMKAMMSDWYLEDLSKMTRRGLEGAALKGQATGGLAFGYTSRAIVSGGREPDGYEILVDAEEAQVVIRIFTLYRDGHSLLGIAELLNSEGVSSPRAGASKKGRPAFWRKPTLREMLRNRSYLGEWTFGAKKWSRDPLTRKRRSTKQTSDNVHSDLRPHLQIIQQPLWDAVQARLAQVTRAYQKGNGGAAATRASRPFSGLLSCGVCGRPMVRSGGSSAVMYKCSGAHSGRACENRQGVREDTLVTHAVEELQRVLTQTDLYSELLGRITERLKSYRVQADDQRVTLAKDAGRLEGEEAKLVAALQGCEVGSGAFAAITRGLDRLAEQKKKVAEQLATLSPVEAPSMPTVDQVAALASDVASRVKDDPIGAREILRRMLDGGGLKMTPLADGSYQAESVIFPFTLTPKSKKPRNLLGSEASLRSGETGCCAGRI